MRATAVCSVHTMFARQAALTPDRVAIVYGNRSVSYGDLDRLSLALARTLRARGVGPRSLVGLHIDRSPEMIVGLLAVLRCGAAYVPLDPSFPEDRIDYMIRDAHLRVVVTEPQFAQRLSGGGLDLVFVDVAASPSASDRTGEPFDDYDSAPDDVAYVIYTSGSTGRPKGVEVTHGGVVNFLDSMQVAPGCGEADVLLAVTTLSFDIAVLELLLPLVTGARVVLASRSAATDGRALTQMLAHEGITIMQATPSTWRLLIEAGWTGTPELKVLCGGEALSRNLANELLDRCAELWNMYGPTETTIWSAIQRITSRDGVISLGQPIANTTLHVLDVNLHAVPDGDAGELYIGGAGLARGYLNRPDLTVQRFVRDPLSDDPASRLYRTGDLVRRAAGGALEFLGRVDHQVKVSGYRIELGEIEAVIEEHPAVVQAVVAARQRPGGGDGDQRLVAYVVLRAQVANLNSVLRAHVRQKLPAYMVPAIFVRVDAFAKTPNGKINRGALPDPQWSAAFDSSGQVAPRTQIEKDLAAIWARVLNVPSIGVTDSFFDLGASSLDGARLLAEMETRFGHRLPLGALFQAPTIERFAALLGSPSGGSGRTSLVPLQPLGSQRPLFCVHGGAGTIYLFHPLAQRLGRDQPVFAFQARGLYGRDCPHRHVEEMAAHYIEEMKAVQPAGPYAISGYCFGGIVAYEMARQLSAAGEQISLLALFNAPNYLYYSEQGGDQRMFAPEDAAPAPPERQPGMLLKRAYWYVAKEVRTRSALKRLGWRVVRALRLPVPLSMRDYYFRLNSWKAERDYAPAPYGGRMLLFRAERLERDPLLGWGSLVAGGVESHAVPANQRTREIMEEPWVGAVASVLQRQLRPAPEATPRPSPVAIVAADSVDVYQ